MPRLSVLMPAYNAERTVASAIRSTLQDLPRDAELVVLDDGSTDGTADAAMRAGDSRVRVISRPNAGVAASLNELLDTTDSEFVARMDADDLVLPGRFRRQLRAVSGRAGSGAAGGADAVFTTVVEWGSGRPRLPRPSGIAPDDFPLHLLLTNPVAHSTLLARRSAVAAVGGYRLLPTEDYDLWLRMAADGSRLRRLGAPGLAYRVHAGQVTASAEWRRSSWENREIAEAFARLAEQRLGGPATRITALSIDERLSATEKLERFEEFAGRFERALEGRDGDAVRALRRKLAERREWLERRVAEQATGQRPSAPSNAGGRPVPGETPRERFRTAWAADRRANAAYPKSLLVLRWFRSAQRWRETRGPLARAMFLLVGGSYKLATEGLLGIELPVSTPVGPGLRLRHCFGIVVNPATRIGSGVMLRQGVTLGNRVAARDCPTIGDGVEIGVGAVVIGAIDVGAGARIGPCAVVFRDVPRGAVVYSPESRVAAPAGAAAEVT